ncbi:MAG: CtsR family transcriptional regulator [Ruminococcaceae bacterium]|nr:CtsR family transcriptional regulator [Oscillospiraceae bacterium]
MRASDIISAFIMEMLEEANGEVELKRNELAQQFNVVPSQINYVISSRFTPEQGFRIESRRGGGGYIRICRINSDRSAQLMHIINSIGASLSAFDAQVFLKNMYDYGYIDEKVFSLVSAAVSDNTLTEIPQPQRDRIRATLAKALLMRA